MRAAACTPALSRKNDPTMSVTAYDQLCDTAREVALLTSTESALSWDQETFMPAKALTFRASQMSWLSGKAHALATGRMMEKLLDKALESKLRDPKQRPTSK